MIEFRSKRDSEFGLRYGFSPLTLIPRRWWRIVFWTTTTPSERRSCGRRLPILIVVLMMITAMIVGLAPDVGWSRKRKVGQDVWDLWYVASVLNVVRSYCVMLMIGFEDLKLWMYYLQLYVESIDRIGRKK